MIIAPPYEEPCADCAALRQEMAGMHLAMRLQDARINMLNGAPPEVVLRVDRQMEQVTKQFKVQRG